MKEYQLSLLYWATLWAWCVGCTDQTVNPEEFVWAQQSGELVTCEETIKPTVIQGYETEVELVSIHGHEFNLITGNALYSMQQQAQEDGVELRILQGFIPHDVLETLFACGPEGTCDCNWCNATPFPGYSPHQAGTAVDLDLTPPGTLEWLETHAGTYGFSQNILGIKWHWVHDGTPISLGPCIPELSGTAVTLVDTNPQIGFWSLRTSGAITPYGEVQYLGAPSPLEFPAKWVALSPNQTHDGYWVLSDTGQVEGFGMANSEGNAAITFSSGGAVGIAAHWASGGYWIATEDGAIQTFGGAPALEEVQVSSSSSPTISMVGTNEGDGFWLLRQDGTLRLFNAPFYGELNPTSNMGIATGLTPTPSGEGYWILTESGVVVPFGDASSVGSVQGLTDTPVTDILRTASDTGSGCWILEESGALTSLGDAANPVQGAKGYFPDSVTPPSFTLMASYSPDRSDPFPLDGATIKGDVYVFVTPIADISRVRFAVDSDPVTGVVIGEDKTWPFDLAGGNPQGANPFDTFTLENGERLMNVIVERLHGIETSWTSAIFSVDNPVCGDGKLEGGEQCDSGPCCDPEKCQILDVGTPCREKAGKCDIEEFCDGGSPFCPADAWLSAGTICRPAGTSCDVEEACEGNGPACPSNAVLPEGTPCEEEGYCELGFCILPEPEEDIVEQEDTASEEDAGVVPDMDGISENDAEDFDADTSNGEVESEITEDIVWADDGASQDILPSEDVEDEDGSSSDSKDNETRNSVVDAAGQVQEDIGGNQGVAGTPTNPTTSSDATVVSDSDNETPSELISDEEEGCRQGADKTKGFFWLLILACLFYCNHRMTPAHHE